MTLISDPVAVLVIIILVCMIPAYVLFKVLPSRADVTGPFQGLEIKLGGAFGGYFLLLCLIFYQWSRWNPTPSSQVWEISGQVSKADGTAIEPLQLSDISLQPPATPYLPQGGGFSVNVTTQAPPAGEGIEFPTLSIGHQGYKSVTVLDAKGPVPGLKVDFDPSHHRITFQSIPLQTETLPDYSPSPNLILKPVQPPTSSQGAPQ